MIKHGEAQLIDRNSAKKIDRKKNSCAGVKTRM